MKTHITTFLLLLLALSGCNGDVFVDDFRPSATELQLDGNGDSVTIRFKSGRWSHLTLFDNDDASLFYEVFDDAGEVVSHGKNPVLEGLGKIVCDDFFDKDRMVDFTVERICPQEVRIKVNENALSTPFSFYLTASNEFEVKTINVTLLPSDRYVFDRITYSLNGYSYSDGKMEEDKRLTVHNRGSENVSYTFSPYRDKHRTVRFASNHPEAFLLLADSGLEVEVPGIGEQGYLEMQGDRASYAADWQNLPLPFPDTVQEEVIVPPYTSQRLTLMMRYEWFETDFKLYAVHPKTGKERVITGTLQSKMPIGYSIKSEKEND